MTKHHPIFLLAFLLFGMAFTSCDSESDPAQDAVIILSLTYNGAPLTDQSADLSATAEVVMTFSTTLDPVAVAAALTLTGPQGTVEIDPVFSNSTSRVSFSQDLEPAATYTLRLEADPIGATGGSLDAPLEVTFSTRGTSVITSLPPCTNPPSCLQTIEVSGSGGTADFSFYANYPLFEENASWENLRHAVIVVHGASHNPDDYFSYLTNTLNVLDIPEQTVLVAPYFRPEPEPAGGAFFWKSLNWRDGRPSANDVQISSFDLLDRLIDRLADTAFFPALERIVITGQSSGGRFTHLYAPANTAHEAYPDISFQYIVSESQYFYYPDGQRVNEQTGQLYTPTSCTGYDIWPFGYKVLPPVLANVSMTDFNSRFVERPITYLLGSGSGTDNTLNTTDCSATILGSTRYKRGENMFLYMNTVYPGTHNHDKVIVPGVAHNGSAIYQSAEFRQLLIELLQ